MLTIVCKKTMEWSSEKKAYFHNFSFNFSFDFFNN